MSCRIFTWSTQKSLLPMNDDGNCHVQYGVRMSREKVVKEATDDGEVINAVAKPCEYPT